jgi:hypothetical protein
VQGRRVAELIRHWEGSQPDLPVNWTPSGADAVPLLRILRDWPPTARLATSDVLCSAIHLIAHRIADCVQQHLPRSLPVGQLVLSGPIRQHAFLIRQIQSLLPALDVVTIDDRVATTDSWRAVAAALLGMLHLDQIPANSPALTGAEAPRVLGRISPGAPANWHAVLADLSATLPEKMTLRSAV